MTHSLPSPLHIHRLAVKWRALGLIMVALARRIVRGRKMGAHAALAEAELLEAAVFAAVTELASDLANCPPTARNDDDAEQARTYLHTMLAMLSILALTLSTMRRELEAAAARWRALCGFGGMPPALMIGADTGSLAGLDSS